MTTDTKEVAISVEEADRRLGIGQRNCYRAVADGRLPSLKFGRRLVIPVESLREFANVQAMARTHKPAEAA